MLGFLVMKPNLAFGDFERISIFFDSECQHSEIDACILLEERGADRTTMICSIVVYISNWYLMCRLTFKMEVRL